MKTIIVIPILISLFSCSLLSKERAENSIDLNPPLCLDYYMLSRNELILEFDENIDFEQSLFLLEEYSITQEKQGEKKLKIILSEPLITGKSYTAKVEVLDRSGNGSEFLVDFFGFNDNIPEILINEFSPKGSGNNPDCIELYCKTGGEMGGVTLCVGVLNNFESRYIFPQVEVKAGDYLIVHCKPEGLEEEITEITNITLSGGLLSSLTARDFWFQEDAGLSGNNGVISLYSNPRGEILDIVFYSDRSNEEGWTVSMAEIIEELTLNNCWVITEEGFQPESAVFSGYTTGTRTICRDNLSSDSNSSTDWHTVPTGGKSFGSPNSNSVYIK